VLGTMAGREKDALVNECRFRGVNFLDVSPGLQHVRDRSELEAQQVAGVAMLVGQILAGRQDTVEATLGYLDN
jgi:hypothetical protein